MDLDFWKKIFQAPFSIRLKGGMVQNIATVLLVAVVAMCLIACILNNVWIGLIAISAIFILCFFILTAVIRFAEKNPHAAILDGAQFVNHTKLTMGTKAQPQLPLTLESQVESSPLSLTDENSNQPEKPDEEVPQ